MSGIFISYRREDSPAYAGRLYDRLSAHFGADKVFMDVDDIPPGADFAAQIDAKVASCDAMLVVVGKSWLTARNAAAQLRLSDPNDYVGLEVSLALQRGILVIPALVGGAEIPKTEELRSDLKPLARRNALILGDQDFQRDTDQLIQALESIQGLRKQTPDKVAIARAEVRKRLLRRLIWKVPLILLLIGFAVWWESRKRGVEDTRIETHAAAFTGNWSGQVSYPWDAKFTEVFFFQPEGAKLFGTASFLGVKRGIEEGKIEGENISFYIRYEEVSGDERRERKNYCWGKLNGDKIRMRMQDDRGNPAVEWVLSKTSTSG
jgi:hypothetical protein